MTCRLAKRAETDLADIAYYIASESGSLEVASGWTQPSDSLNVMAGPSPGHPRLSPSRGVGCASVDARNKSGHDGCVLVLHHI
jgi:hypothetical protein